MLGLLPEYIAMFGSRGLEIRSAAIEWVTGSVLIW
jgi:hypothetical protein